MGEVIDGEGGGEEAGEEEGKRRGRGGAAGSNVFEVDGRRPRPVERDGGGWARLSAAIGAA